MSKRGNESFEIRNKRSELSPGRADVQKFLLVLLLQQSLRLEGRSAGAACEAQW